MDGKASISLVRALEGGSYSVPQTEPEYTQSCYLYAHEPACKSYLAHLRRLRAERDAAGGEAQLKAKVGYWEKLGRWGNV